MSQSLAKVYLHIVFSTKNRAPLLADGWRDELFQVIGGSANNLGCQSLIVGGVCDHVHQLLILGRTITIADAIGKIKSTSSLWINQSRSLPTPFHWQGGYAANFPSASRTWKRFGNTSASNRSITNNKTSRMSCANGCGATKSNGTNVTCGTEMNGPFRTERILTDS